MEITKALSIRKRKKRHQEEDEDELIRKQEKRDIRKKMKMNL